MELATAKGRGPTSTPALDLRPAAAGARQDYNTTICKLCNSLPPRALDSLSPSGAVASMKRDRRIPMEPMDPSEPAAIEPSDSTSAAPWLTLTGLGRIYGISAVHCGRLLSDAGLRDGDGQPTLRALDDKLAYQRHPQHGGRNALWQRQGCSAILEAGGLVPMQQTTLVEQWVALLSALDAGSPSISTSAQQMAEDLPKDLVEPVNRQLRAIGCSFQVSHPRPLSSPNPGSNSKPGSPRAGSRRSNHSNGAVPLAS